MIEKLNDQNYVLQAMRVYDNPNCHSMEEFKRDLNTMKYIKRLLNKYLETGEIKERLLLNHIIIFCNAFGGPSAVKFLFYKIDSKGHSALKTILIFLNLMPTIVEGIGEKNIRNSDIPVDFVLANILRKI